MKFYLPSAIALSLFSLPALAQMLPPMLDEVKPAPAPSAIQQSAAFDANSGAEYDSMPQEDSGSALPPEPEDIGLPGEPLSNGSSIEDVWAAHKKQAQKPMN